MRRLLLPALLCLASCKGRSAPAAPVPEPVTSWPSWMLATERPPTRVAGMILRDGVPVEGATVELRLTAVLSVPSAVSAVRSGTDGRFDLGVQPDVEYTVLVSEGRDFVQVSSYPGSPLFGASALVAVLEPCKEMRGVVVDEHDRPMADATVVAGQKTLATTAADGAFVACAYGTLTVTADGREKWASRRAPASPMKVRLGPGARLDGVVTDETGEPVAGAIVRASPWIVMAAGASTVTDAHGRFRLDGLGARRHELSIEHGRRRASGWLSFARGEQRTGLLVALRGIASTVAAKPSSPPAAPQHTLRGLVVSPGGTVAGVRVRASWQGGDHTALTDTSGRFQLAGIPEGRAKVDVLTIERRKLSTQVDVNAASAAEELRLSFEAEGWVRGQLVYPDGTAAAGVQIQIRGADGSTPPPPSLVNSDGQGRFTFADLAPGDYHVVKLESRGRKAEFRQLAAVHVEAGEPTLVTVTVEPRSVSGRVVSASGEPVADAIVQVWAGQDVVTAGKDGAFVVPITAGANGLIAYSPTGGSGHGGTDDAVLPTPIVITEPGILDLTIRGASGAWRVTIAPHSEERCIDCIEPPRPIWDATFESTSLRASGLTPGSYSVDAEGPAGAHARAVVRIRAGETRPLELRP